MCTGSMELGARDFRFEGVTAEVWAGFVLNGRGARKGIATENLEARKRVRYSRPAQETALC